jgi:hypothetical protein
MKTNPKLISALQKGWASVQILQDHLKNRRWIKFLVNTALILFMILIIARYIQKDWQEIQKTQFSFNSRALWFICDQFLHINGGVAFFTKVFWRYKTIF